MQRIVPRHCRERAGLDFDLPGCTSPLIPAALAPPFPLIVTIIIPATCCDPVRFMSSTSSHAIAVVVVVRIIIVAVLVAVMVVAMRTHLITGVVFVSCRRSIPLDVDVDNNPLRHPFRSRPFRFQHVLYIHVRLPGL